MIASNDLEKIRLRLSGGTELLIYNTSGGLIHEGFQILYKYIGLAPPRNWRPLLRQVLDPPLNTIIHYYYKN